LTGVAGFAAFTGAAGAVAAHGLGGLGGPGGWGGLSSAAMRLVSGGADAAPSGGQLNGSGQYQEELVPCDANKLIAAIVRGNASGGARLRLAGRCTYTLTTPQGPDGLPVITAPITVNGQGATIVRAAGAANFRIVNVGPGGDLTLENLTVTGGFAPEGVGGGGILVQSGGRATLRDATVTGNQSMFVGGGIANYGVTTVLGQDGGKGAKDTTAAPADGPRNAPANGSTQASPGGRGTGPAGTGTAQFRSRVSHNAARTGGGGIYNEGRLTASNTEVSYNNSTSSGGGVSNSGGATLVKTRIDHNNSTAGDGGGIASFDTITTLEDSFVADNTADGRGGGITSVGSAFYLRGTGVDRNTAGLNGGGVYNQSDLAGIAHLVVEQSEVNGNTTASSGGGIANISGGDLVLRRSQVNLNTAVGVASQGGGIFNDSISTASLTAAQVAKNSSTVAPGGIFSEATIAVDNKSVIVANRPTNCAGSPNTVPNCFG
jgi:hypothetical protein